MKTILYLTLLLFIAGCQQASSPSDKENKEADIKSNKTLTIQVDGMTCTGCETAIENKIRGLPGIANVTADHEKGLTTIEFDSSKVNKSSFESAIESTGYQVIKK